MSDGGIFDELDEGSHDADLPEVEPVIAQPVINKSKKQLICVADQTGNPLVATGQYDKSGQFGLIEPYRRPSQQEWLHLTQTGQIVKQGNGSVKVNSGVGQTSPTEANWKKPAKIAAAVLGVGAIIGGGIFMYRKSRNQNPSEPPEPQEPNEPDDDDDDDDDDDGDED